MFLDLRRRNHIPNASSAISAIPPITPPTIAPTGVDDFDPTGLKDADCDVDESPPLETTVLVVAVVGCAVDADKEVEEDVGDADVDLIVVGSFKVIAPSETEL